MSSGPLPTLLLQRRRTAKCHRGPAGVQGIDRVGYALLSGAPRGSRQVVVGAEEELAVGHGGRSGDALAQRVRPSTRASRPAASTIVSRSR